MQQIELHPLCTLFPRLAGAEFQALCDDIAANGLRNPIVTHDGMILDGGNRYRACLDAGVEPTFAKFSGGNLVSFVLSANMHRRHLSAGQQAAIVASAQDWAQAQPRGGDRKSDQSATLHLDSVAKRSAESGASIRTQKMADKVAKASPELAQKVAHGEVSLPKAVKQIAPAKPKPAPEPANDDGPTLAELVDELQAENTRLTAEIQAAEADDAVAEAVKWRRCYDHAVRQQSEAMDSAKRAEKREAWTKRQLMRCGKAVGEEDPTKIAAKVEALSRQKVAA